MKAAKLTLIVVALIAMVSTVSAQDTSQSKREPENLYLTAGIGAGRNVYPAETTGLLEAFYGRPESGRLNVAMEGGVLMPLLGRKTLLGLMFSLTTEGEDGDKVITSSYSLTDIHVSIRHFISAPGDGLYLRGDIGIAQASSTTTGGLGSYGVDNGDHTNGNWGGALLVGAGYAFPLSSGTSLSIDATYTGRLLPGYDTGTWATSNESFENGVYSTAAVIVSVLW